MCNFEINFRRSNHNVPSGSSANPYARGPKDRVFTHDFFSLDKLPDEYEDILLNLI